MGNSLQHHKALDQSTVVKMTKIGAQLKTEDEYVNGGFFLFILSPKIKAE